MIQAYLFWDKWVSISYVDIFFQSKYVMRYPILKKKTMQNRVPRYPAHVVFLSQSSTDTEKFLLANRVPRCPAHVVPLSQSHLLINSFSLLISILIPSPYESQPSTTVIKRNLRVKLIFFKGWKSNWNLE